MRGMYNITARAIIPEGNLASPPSRPYGRRRIRKGKWGKPFPLNYIDGKFQPRKAIYMKDGDEICIILDWIPGSIKRLEGKS